MGSQVNHFNNSEGRVWVQAGTFNNFTGSNRSNKLRAEAENKLRAEAEKKRCLGTLLFDNYDARKQDISEASSKTCDWLFKTTEFEQWRDRSSLTKDNGVFWLKGKPGSGKSTMMRHISYQLQDSDDAVLVEHFFNARGSSLEKTFLGLLRSLIYQVLSEVPEFYNAFIRIYRRKDMNPRHWEWRQSELRNFLRSILKRSKRKLIILVDALDERGLDETALVVSFLESLSLDAVEARANLRICLSSRHYPNVSMKKNLEFTLDGNAEHDKDIKKYVWAKLRTRNPEIKWRIFQKANGVFLWVVLVVEILNKTVDRGHPEEMQKTLDTIPSDLDNFFERLIFSDPEKNPETLLMFQLVLFSKEELTPAQLVFAVIARFHKGYLKPRSQSKMKGALIRARIVDSSKGLLEVSDSTLRVQFIHQTVMDFFLRNRRLERFYYTPEPDAIAASHDQLRACCLHYIEKFPIDSQPHDGQSADELEDEYPFLRYSVMHLLDHAEAALQGHQLDIESGRWLLSPDPWFKTWKRIMFAIEETRYLQKDINVGLVYILIRHKFHNLLAEVLRRSDVDVNAQGGTFNNALQLAVTKQDDLATSMLLDVDANVHLNGGHFGTVLQVASALGNRSLVSTILEKGADLNAFGGIFGTALQAAAAHGDLEILKTLLERGAKVNVFGGIYGTALQGAAHSGNLEGVKLLLKQGALTKSDRGIYGSALLAAMEGQKVEIFKHLLRAGADVNSRGGFYGSWSTLDKILDEPATLEYILRSSSGLRTDRWFSLENGPAIVWAARKSEYDQVRLLLENGAGVNAASGPWESQVPVMGNQYRVRGLSLDYELGMTALIWAARNGNRDIIELLLEYGADLEAHSSSGETALLAGSEAGHEGIVKFLIDHGADQSAKDMLGENAFYKAAANGHVDVMRLLLDHEDLHDTHQWSEPHVIRYTAIDTMIVNGGFSSFWSHYHENDGIGTPGMTIQCLIVNGGCLYAGPEPGYLKVFIERIQINGGICYFDMTDLDTSFHIRKLEINGGSFQLMAHANGREWLKRDIESLDLHNGNISISTIKITLHEVLLSGGSFNCNSTSDVNAHQVTLGSTRSGSSKNESIHADPLSISGRPEIYIKYSDDQVEQHGTVQPGDQNFQMNIVLSPLYVAARNGHLEAVQFLLKSGAKFQKAWPIINPLYIAQRHGHNEIVRFLQEKGQEKQEKKERQKEDNDDETDQETEEKKEGQEAEDNEKERETEEKKRRDRDEKEKEVRSTREKRGDKKQKSKRRWQTRRERNVGDCRML